MNGGNNGGGGNFEQRDMSGVLFKNDKGENDRRPDYKGRCVINGQNLNISAWIKDGRNGKYMSLAFDVPQQQQQQGQQQQRPQQSQSRQAPKNQGGGVNLDEYFGNDDDQSVPF